MSAKATTARKTSGATRKTAGTSEIFNDAFREAMRTYGRALEAGIEFQEESVKLWRGVLLKLASPEKLQGKLESMSAKVFPKARIFEHVMREKSSAIHVQCLTRDV